MVSPICIRSPSVDRTLPNARAGAARDRTSWVCSSACTRQQRTGVDVRTSSVTGLEYGSGCAARGLGALDQLFGRDYQAKRSTATQLTAMKPKTANIDIRVEMQVVEKIDVRRIRQRVPPSRSAAIVYMFSRVRTLKVYLASALWILLSVTASAQTSASINFDGYEPPLPQILGTAWVIFGNGIIDNGASERLRTFLVTNRVPSHSILHLNSEGGDLLEGMKLGRLIREYGLFTYIGTKGNGLFKADPGGCYSACALAFLGGEYRFSTQGSVYGVHRFYARTNAPLNADVAQILSASVVQYIRDMGVDPALFTLMTEAGASDIVRVPVSIQTRLGVVNNGQGPTVWSIESIPGGIYLKGARETWRGMNKFIIACPGSGSVMLQIFYDSERRGDEITKHFTEHSLFIDNDEILINHLLLGKPLLRADNGVIGASYRLTDELLRKLATARSVGIAMSPPQNTQIFMGFIDISFADAAQKLPGFLAVCRRK